MVALGEGTNGVDTALEYIQWLKTFDRLHITYSGGNSILSANLYISRSINRYYGTCIARN